MKWPDTVVMLSLRQLSGYMQCSYVCTVWCLCVCTCMCVMDLCVGGWVGGCGCVLPPVQVYCSIDMQALTFVLVRLNSLVFIIQNCCLSI